MEIKEKNNGLKYFYMLFGALVFYSLFNLFYDLVIEYPKVKQYDFIRNSYDDQKSLKNLKLRGVIFKTYGNAKMGFVMAIRPESFDTINKYSYKGEKCYFYDYSDSLIWVSQSPYFIKTSFKKGRKIVKDFGEIGFTVVSQLPHE